MEFHHNQSKEYVLDDTETIVSKTDPYGNITYINNDFIRISGFSKEELLGAPQNIIRHPDMPKEAFYDLWHTIKSGKAWSGLVKNRCKNGDYYWVEAHVAPITENGQVTGYTSIRVKPSREKVNAAARAYRAIREGDRHITVRDGAIIRRPRWARHPQHAPHELSLRHKLSIWCAGLTLLFAASIVAAWQLYFSGYVIGDALPLAVTLLAGAGIAMSCAGGVALYRAVIQPLAQAQAAIDLMCTGDLSGRINAIGNNEISHLMQSLRKFQINIKLLIGQIKESTTTVDTQVERLVEANLNLSDRTRSQASNIAQTSAYMSDITSSIQQYAENATAANTLVTSTTQAATQGTHAIARVTNTMDTIQESAKKIEDITALIDEIAFQTNILALNAAVEAAHAGSQGQGFAVVAAEVRRLALRSADAANDIKALIQDSVSRVDEGSIQVSQTASIMDNILDFAQKASTIMHDIAVTSHEQSTGIEQINLALSQIEAITRENRNQVTHTAEFSQEAYHQVDRLSELVDEFKLVGAAEADQKTSASFSLAQQPLLITHELQPTDS